MSLKLKLDGWVKRDPDRSARNIPGKQLTEKQKQHLAKVCWIRCMRAYKNRMMASALISDFETDKDLDAEAYIAMWNILNKFDISKCGLIAKFDVPGAKNPKTLEFYFINYFYGRVNFIACEARAMKKQRGIGPADGLNEIAYDPADVNNVTEHNHEYEITGVLLQELKKKNDEFQRFFYQTFKLQCTQREMREEYGDKFNILRHDLMKFIEDIKKQHKSDYKYMR
jgi:hypothetical protein